MLLCATKTFEINFRKIWSKTTFSQVPVRDLEEAAEYLAEALMIRQKYANFASHKICPTTSKYIQLVGFYFKRV